MSSLDLFLKQAQIPQKVPVKLKVDPVPQAPSSFPSAPTDVFHKIAPTPMKDEINARPFEDQLQTSDSLSAEGEAIANLAKALREFDEVQLVALKQKQKKAIQKLRDSFGYSDKTRELEQSVQSFGNKIINVMGETGETIKLLARLQEHWLYISKEPKTTETKPDSNEALLQALKEKLSPKTVQDIIARAGQIVQEGTEVLVSIDTRLTVAPIREDFHTKKQSLKEAVRILIAEVEDELIGQIKQFEDHITSFESMLVMIQTDIGDAIGHGDVTQVDFNQDQKVAANRK